MLRKACEHFGEELLTREEREQIFEEILGGPSKDSYRSWTEFVGEEFTEEGFSRRQRGFHRFQLRPFAAVLFGDYASYYGELEAETEEAISDDDYGAGETKAGFDLPP